jgi:hypothetical protein
MNDAVRSTLSQFRNCTTVAAVKITQLLPSGDGANIVPASGEPFFVDADWVRVNDPHAGGYYVMHPDGGTSFMPAAHFDQAYAPIGEGLAAANDQAEPESPAGPNVEAIARKAHDVHRAYCEAIGDPVVPWDEMTEEARAGVIRGVHFNLEHPDAGPQASHEAWLSDHVAAGWTYGSVKNEETKQHPNLVSYDDLPLEQRAKDHIFRGVVLALAS